MLVPYLRLSNSGKYVSLLDCNTVDSQLACATENSAAIEMTYGAGMEISRSIKSRTIPSHRDSVVSIGAIGDCHLADVGCTHDGTGTPTAVVGSKGAVFNNTNFNKVVSSGVISCMTNDTTNRTVCSNLTIENLAILHIDVSIYRTVILIVVACRPTDETANAS